MTTRQCPSCLSLGTLSPSHRRDSHETFLAVVMPFIFPYRCSACNWRGMMGRMSFDANRKINITINSLIYVAVLTVAIFVLVTVRQQLHPI